MISFHSLSQEECADALTNEGEKPFRAKQIFQWVYGRREIDWDKMTDLGGTLREKLKGLFSLSTLKSRRTLQSKDEETIKFLWELSDGKLVESVLILSSERRTVCVSSQVGCPARCAFCASGKNGLLRNLDTAEIIEQIIQTDQYLKDKGEKVCHIVFMGMGEPFENYDNVLKSIRLINDPKCLNISQRKITVS